MRATVVIGSPKPQGSASDLLAGELAAGLEARGVDVERLHALAALRSAEETDRLLRSLEAVDLVVLAFPLYVDSLPAPLIRVLELTAERGLPAGKRLAAIVQCGFPEAAQCDTASETCRLFAEHTGMRFAGALEMGMGGSLGGGLDRLPGGGANVRESLSQAAAALASGSDIPAEARILLARPLMPRWLYVGVANLGWRLQMRERKARRGIAYRPYA